MPSKLRAAAAGCLAASSLAVAWGWAQAAGPIVGPTSWPVYELSPAHNPVYEPNAGAGVSWAAKVPGGVIGGVIVVGRTLYGGGLDGTVFALDATTGKRLWETHLPNSIFSPPTYAGGMLYVGIGNDVFRSLSGSDWIRGEPPSAVYALDAQTGRIRWAVGSNGADKVSPLDVGGVVYEPDAEHWLRAIAAATGRVLWKVNDGGVDDFSAPAYADGILYLNTGGPAPSALRAFSAKDGHLLWTYVGTNADNSPTLGGGEIFTMNTLPIEQAHRWYLSDQVVALDLSGRRLWSYTTSDGPMPPAYQAPLGTYDQGVFYDGSTVRPYLYAFAARTGHLLWKAHLPGFAYGNPVVVQNRLIAATANGYLAVIDAASGRVLRTVNLHALLGAGAPIVVDGTVYVGGTNGTPSEIVRGAKVSGEVWAFPLHQLLQ